jgi:hypothetical protein
MALQCGLGQLWLEHWPATWNVYGT